MKLVLAQIIVREMERRGITLLFISEATGIPRSTLHDWSAGVRPHQADLVYKLSELFRRENETPQDAFFRIHFGEVDTSKSQEEQKEYFDKLIAEFQINAKKKATKSESEVDDRQLPLFGKEFCA